MRREISYDPRFGEYGSFLDSEFPEKLVGACGKNEELRAIAFDLVFNWRSASYSGAMPSIVVKNLEAYHNGYLQSLDPNGSTLQFSDAILQRMCQRTDRIAADPKLQRVIRRELIDVAMELHEARKLAEDVDTFPLEETWQRYLVEPAFQMAVWGTLRIVFVSVYNSYEDFLVHATKLAAGLSRLRTSHKTFLKALQSSFGTEVTEAAWTNEQLNFFRLVRHSLSHAGGRITDELRGKENPFPVADGRMHVFPAHIRELYGVLRIATMAICKHDVFHTTAVS